jgi:hypothetical protein
MRKTKYNQGDLIQYSVRDEARTVRLAQVEPQLLVIVEVLDTHYKVYWCRKRQTLNYSHQYFDRRSAFSLVVRGQ